MYDTYHISKCLNLIQEQLPWGKVSDWTNKDFEVLSEKIYEKTGILISYQTLRRLYGKVQTSEKYKPQLETKNALAIFVGFKDWDAFKLAHPLTKVQETVLVEAVPEKLVTPIVESKTKRLSLTIIFSILITLVLGTGAYYLLAGKFNRKIFFKGKNIIGNVPLNVVFHYNIDHVKADSVILDFGTENKKIVLPRNQKTVTMSYLIPGFYSVAVKADNKVIGKETVYAKSNGWSGVVYKETGYYFLKDSSFIKDGVMSYLPFDTNLRKLQIYKPIKKTDLVEFNNFRDFNIDGNNFTLETRMKIILPGNGQYCYKAYIKVRGEKYPVRAAFVSKGCNTDALLQFSEKLLDGRFHDLNFMGQDLTKWRNIKIEVKNKMGRLYMDNHLLQTINFNNDIGQIKGLSFRLREFGTVDYVKLYNGKDKLVYQEEFISNTPK